MGRQHGPLLPMGHHSNARQQGRAELIEAIAAKGIRPNVREFGRLKVHPAGLRAIHHPQFPNCLAMRRPFG